MRDHPIGNALVLGALMEYFLWAVPFIGAIWLWKSEEHKFSYKLFIPLYIIIALISAAYDSLLTARDFSSQVRVGGFWWNFIRDLINLTSVVSL